MHNTVYYYIYVTWWQKVTDEELRTPHLLFTQGLSLTIVANIVLFFFVEKLEK